MAVRSVSAGGALILKDIHRPSHKKSRVAAMTEKKDDMALCQGFTKAEEDLVTDNEAAISASWERLLNQLRKEVKKLKDVRPNIIPTIEYAEIKHISKKAQSFLDEVKKMGAGVIRNTIMAEEVQTWRRELDEYIADNPHTKTSAENPELYELFWSSAQLKARADPNVLGVQKFVMCGCWHRPDDTSLPTGEDNSQAQLCTKIPISCADRLQMIRSGSESRGALSLSPSSTHSNGGSVAGPRAECGCGGHAEDEEAYRDIMTGNWEAHDPWDIGTRLHTSMDDPQCKVSMHSGVCKMFQGVLALDVDSSTTARDIPVRLCALPLKLTVAYRLLRPFFAPLRGGDQLTDDFLDPSNWLLKTTPKHARTLNGGAHEDTIISDSLHPHLQLDKALVPIPSLNPGDYVVWHPDALHSVGSCPPLPPEALPKHKPNNGAEMQSPPYSPSGSTTPPPQSPPQSGSQQTTLLYIPACPLTPSSALFLSRQRRAFLLGFPGLGAGGGEEEIGESRHLGRAGVQEVNEAGGEAALRAMGLLAWDEEEEEDGVDERERRVMRLANKILFPDF